MSTPTGSFDAALGKVPSGCFIITAGRGQAATGFLASWVQQVSFEPLALMVCIKKGRSIFRTIEQDREFTVNIVPEGRKDLLGHFARGFEPGQDAFQGIETATGNNGIPCISSCAGYLECRVLSSATPGDHHVVFAEVLGGASSSLSPYVHIRRSGKNY